jgi:hypothetical protein
VSTDLLGLGLVSLPVHQPSQRHAQSFGDGGEGGGAGLPELSALDQPHMPQTAAREAAQSALGQPGSLPGPSHSLTDSNHGEQESTLEQESTQVDSPSPPGVGVKSPAMSLLKRMQDVMKWKGWSAREWARQSSLKEEANVSQIMRALAKSDDPEKVFGTGAFWVALSRSAGVSLDWLLTGRGSPYSFTVEVHDDPRYPSRARVIGVAHLLGFHEAAIQALLSQAPERDPGPDYWLRLLQAEQLKISASAGPAPEKVRK